jgi:hypothetical protein
LSPNSESGEKSEIEELRDRVDNLEASAESVLKMMNRRNQELVGLLLTLSLPMSDRRRIETSVEIMKALKLDDTILKNVIDRYFKEGIRSELRFEEIVDPLISSFGFEHIWKLVEREKIRTLFGTVAESKWMDMERNYPCEERQN